MDAPNTLNVTVVARDPLVRTGLAAALEPDLEVVGQATSLAEAEVFGPDVILWDFDAGEEVTSLDTPVVALVHEGETNASEVLGAGTASVLYRDAEVDKIVAALNAAVQGLVVLEPSLTTSLQEPVMELDTEPLTTREGDVLQLLAQGASNKAIAKTLDISESTAKFHTSAILSKLGVKSRTEAVVRAAQLGLILL